VTLVQFDFEHVPAVVERVYVAEQTVHAEAVQEAHPACVQAVQFVVAETYPGLHQTQTPVAL